MLKPGGRLFLDTGLAGDAVDRWAPGLVQWYDAPQHLFVFSRDAITRLLDEAGFTIVRIDLNFERTLLRRIGKYVRNRLLAGVGGAFFRLILDAAAFSKMRRENKMPFGSLMLIVAIKKGDA